MEWGNTVCTLYMSRAVSNYCTYVQMYIVHCTYVQRESVMNGMGEHCMYSLYVTSCIQLLYICTDVHCTLYICTEGECYEWNGGTLYVLSICHELYPIIVHMYRCTLYICTEGECYEWNGGTLYVLSICHELYPIIAMNVLADHVILICGLCD